MKIIEMENETSLEIDISIMEQIAQDLTARPVELIIVNEEEMKVLNEQHRGSAYATDVLSFPIAEVVSGLEMPLGSVVICEQKILEFSKKLSHTISEESTLLFVHGLLHLLGYDHENDEGQMRAYEEKIIEKYSLPNSLIVRNY